MGRRKDGKAKTKLQGQALTPRQRMVGDEKEGSSGDARKKSTKRKERTKHKEKSERAEKDVKKAKAVKSKSVESFDDDVRVHSAVLDEPEDGNFVPNKRGKKRKRQEEPIEGPSTFKMNNLKEEDEASSGAKEKSRKMKKPKEEEGACPVTTKKSKEEKGECPVTTKKKSKEEKGECPVTTKKKSKEEKGECPVTTKKKSKEEIAAGKALKIKKKEEEEQQRWRWWEEAKYEDGVKWKFLEHKGPHFPPEYQPLPDNVHFYYNGNIVKLSLAAEEVALFYAQMLDHEYTTKEVFRNNFFKDWRKEMTLEERMLITDLSKCDFGELHAMHVEKVEARKAMNKEDKLVIKEANQRIVDEYGFCMLDNHRERIGNFKIEPPGLFRGRGEHPKQGYLKKRIQPEDVIINCGKGSRVPEPPAGHRWKEVRYDNTVTWLASWTENVQGSCKYIMLNPSSKLKGEKDWEKYEVARRLKSCVDRIRLQYQQDLKSKQMVNRQRAVALYFIDVLALRAGNEKEEGETADTVGCCSLRVEHITLYDRLEGSDCVVEFDFLGKDCIRYYNKVPVTKRVFKNLKLFMENKEPGDDLFDRLNTGLLNKHLSSLMPGLTAKVFRTYNASITLQEQLRKLSNGTANQAEKLLSYNRANRAVAVLCNHQRAPPKTFDQSMANLQSKIEVRREQLTLAKSELTLAKKEVKGHCSDSKLLALVERKKKAVQRCEEQIMKMEVQATDREENKQIALGTSKLNYLDPRISIAWCKNMEVPLEKIYNKSQRDKFAWAVDMTQTDFIF
ncbi:DNA topoisomerase I, mitochondrial isoform X3 [Esox lucius]|nr:DNA topoisomerase I, mitochondrial isoform X3 [Esox lucius]XP_028970865.2 DNA topoisomerase I, mitochondrial isoform X3 [Esox lucius]XP_028970866.2 DNA topoisomerase I, mitochondrial isoform X3 [Esox lucius]XP_028970867.2 DNA topoisomerase I, mitochondrial isoform X3 [Esox lucius]XP_028970868.2 DNA topoisomerase I, mitochondrial isoform X3 [Esox lucius]